MVMRNPERLVPFYIELLNVHRKSFPDWRFGQLMENFRRWHQARYGVDIFHPEEDEMLNRLYKYANESSPCFRVWEVTKNE